MISHLFRSYHFLLLFASISIQTAVVVGDEFDDVIEDAIADLGLRGAAITYFDKNTMQAPITRGYGKVAASDSSSDVTPDTTFNLASISKPFVASAVAILVDKGVISSLDDDICNVLPKEFSDEMCRNPAYPDQEITWRMLMTHRSSMDRDLPWVKNEFGDWIAPSSGPSNTLYTDYEDTGNPTCPLDDVVNFYRTLLSNDPEAQTTVGVGVKVKDGEELNWYELGMSEGIWRNYQPGEKSEYSNAAYGYLTALIELASGQSFPDFCRENLFAPLGMDTTAWFLEDLPASTLQAVPQEINDNGDFSDIEQYCYIDYGSGSLHTTVNDLVKWGDAMLTYGTQRLWSSAIGNEIAGCQERDENNAPIEDCEFGYGWILLNNDMKRRRSRHLQMKRRRDRNLESDDDDDATFAPSSSISFSDSFGTSESTSDENSDNDSEESSTFSPSDENSNNDFEESSSLSPSDENSNNDSEESSTLSPSDENSSNDSEESSTLSPSDENSSNDSEESSTLSPSDENSSNDSEESFTLSPSSSTSMEDEDDSDSWDDDEDRFENYDWTGGIMHDGSDAGVSTNMIILPKAGVYVAVLLNTENDDEAVFELTQAVLDAPVPSYNLLDGLESVSMFESVASSSAGWGSFSLTSGLMSASSLLLMSYFLTA